MSKKTAIIGGGILGLAIGYRLSNEHKGYKVTVFEKCQFSTYNFNLVRVHQPAKLPVLPDRSPKMIDCGPCSRRFAPFARATIDHFRLTNFKQVANLVSDQSVEESVQE